MKVIAAYALLVLGGMATPSAADVEKVIKDSGSQADMTEVNALVAALEGKEFHELVAVGMETLASIHGTNNKVADAVVGAPQAEEEKEDDDVNIDGLFGEDDGDIELTGMFGDDDDY